jgi:murein DD-endopeptidase MepM/ murein hydrolase activator NlpD
MAAPFALGFAAGMICLAALLWSTGSRFPAQALAAPEAPAAAGFTLPPAMPGLPQPADAPPEPVSPSLGMPIAGVDPHTLQSNFAQARGGHAHEALDIMAPRGTEVRAVAAGNVVKLFNSKPGGLTVYQFDDSRVWCYYYAHLDRYAAGLKEGMLLRRGEVLGYVGSTGDASPDAPHLHFAVFELGPEKHWWQGTAVDPLPLLR